MYCRRCPLAEHRRRSVEPRARAVHLTRIETWDWGWGGLLLFSLALFFRPQDQVAGLGNAHLSELAAIIGLTAMVFSQPLAAPADYARHTGVAGVFALWGVMLATVPTSLWPADHS
jgi:hypothetical protein